MKANSLRLLALSSVTALGACAGDAGRSGPGVEINVAPLVLSNMQGVQYALAVFNAPPSATGDIFTATGAVNSANQANLVWQQNSVTSGRFGNNVGGDITYIGTCDANVTSGNNWAAIALMQIDVGTGFGSLDGFGPYAGTDNVLDDQNTVTVLDGDADFVNPSPYNDALFMAFPCVENQDTFVEFNLTVMRDADQGFFDVAVNFNDVFCSAKADSCYSLDDNITLLFGDDADDGLGRDHTFVAGFACTVGPDYVNTPNTIIDLTTELLLGDANVTCNDGSVVFTLPLNVLAGNNDTDSVPSGFNLQYAVYHDAEELNCTYLESGPLSCNKTFFNIAINIENLAGQGLTGCTFSFGATAQEQDLVNPEFVGGVLVDTNGVYGAVFFDQVPLVDDAGDTVCDAHPLNGETLYDADSNVTADFLFGSNYGGAHPSLPLIYSSRGGAQAVLISP